MHSRTISYYSLAHPLSYSPAHLWLISGSSTGRDLLNILVIYLLQFIIRVTIVAVSYPLLSRLGRGCSVREAVFIAFSGLRGAFSVSLGLTFSLLCEAGLTRVSSEEGNRLFFYVGE
jgi:NhaP-type Na+/H+ or K+/H+ antiporter